MMVAWQTWMMKSALLVLIHRCGGRRGGTGRENIKLCVPNFVSRSFSVSLAEAFASIFLLVATTGSITPTFYLSEPWTIGCLRNDAGVHSDKGL